MGAVGPPARDVAVRGAAAPARGAAYRGRVTAQGRVGRYVRMVARSGRGADLADALLRVADGLRAAPGCEVYVVNAVPDEPDTVWITEVWADAAASDAALSRDLGEVGLNDVVALLAEPPELLTLSPLGGPGLRAG